MYMCVCVCLEPSCFQVLYNFLDRKQYGILIELAAFNEKKTILIIKTKSKDVPYYKDSERNIANLRKY